jgi:hypothetical protein
MTDDEDFYSLLDDDDDEIADGGAANCLIVPAPCTTPEELNAREEAYRFGVNIPVLFEDTDDGENYFVGNPGEMALAMGVDAAGLTLEQVHEWMAAQHAELAGEMWSVRFDSRK